jgi:hypothetical protein
MLGFAPVSIDRITQAFGRGELKMHGLARKRAEPGGNEEQPRQQLPPVIRLTEEFPGFLGQIEQDCGGVEDANLVTAWSIGIDDRRNLAVGVDGTEGRKVLLALAGVDWDCLIGKRRLLEKKRDFRGVRRGMKIKAYHGRLPG